MPIIAEQYDIDEPVYYVVAVAEASDPNTDLLFLKGNLQSFPTADNR